MRSREQRGEDGELKMWGREVSRRVGVGSEWRGEDGELKGEVSRRVGSEE